MTLILKLETDSDQILKKRSRTEERSKMSILNDSGLQKAAIEPFPPTNTTSILEAAFEETK